MPREKVEARERQLASLEERTICAQTITKRSARRQHLSGTLCRVLDAVADQREALDVRIWRAQPDDAYLEADVQIWRELCGALADFLETRLAP
jgi:hypothetical protein